MKNSDETVHTASFSDSASLEAVPSALAAQDALSPAAGGTACPSWQDLSAQHLVREHSISFYVTPLLKVSRENQQTANQILTITPYFPTYVILLKSIALLLVTVFSSVAYKTMISSLIQYGNSLENSTS